MDDPIPDGLEERARRFMIQVGLMDLIEKQTRDTGQRPNSLLLDQGTHDGYFPGETLTHIAGLKVTVLAGYPHRQVFLFYDPHQSSVSSIRR